MKLSVLWCGLVLWLVSMGAVNAQSFTIGVEQSDYYPISAYRNGQYQGYARELLDAFAKKHGYEFKYSALPIKRLYADFLTRDELDFKYPDNPHWQPDMKEGINIAYSQSLVDSIEGGMVLAERVGTPLSEYKALGTIRGFTPWPYQDALGGGQLRLEESDDLPTLVQKVLLKRVDVMYINTSIANYHLAEDLKKPGALKFDPALPHAPVQYLMSSRKHPKVIEQFNAFLSEEASLVEQLRRKHKLTD
ncbi:substrate-binding periplasmic protein [Pseudomarimonas arenosa]|uniref:Solute-binding protein family 3/N-terminal domain-containing protein n=1 Tax=Pseudomarimonas arenosa TaxID=2774145 RepID=A0AAW3ZRV0_9GAMM|nr:transporter substrate-binding domain-containing protein [Pseudomarimonas arenosa]MBD8527807.1 hypothetical protein [Pseudomarimonas arenosa]